MTVIGALVVANLAAFGAQFVVGDFMMRRFALWPVGAGFESWQIITCAFVHGGAAHIALNMLALWSFGRIVERVLGARRFLVLYFVSVVVAGLVQVAYTTATLDEGIVPTVGASGGVLGVVLAFAMLFPNSRVVLLFLPFPIKAWIMVILFAALDLVTGVTGTLQGIAHFAHLGGMLGAVAVMLSWRRKIGWPIRRD